MLNSYLTLFIVCCLFHSWLVSKIFLPLPICIRNSWKTAVFLLSQQNCVSYAYEMDIKRIFLSRVALSFEEQINCIASLFLLCCSVSSCHAEGQFEYD